MTVVKQVHKQPVELFIEHFADGSAQRVRQQQRQGCLRLCVVLSIDDLMDQTTQFDLHPFPHLCGGLVA